MGSVVLGGFCLVGGLAVAPSASAIPALPTTTSITLPSVTLPPTTSPISTSTSVTVPISTSTSVTVPSTVTVSTTLAVTSTTWGATTTTVVATTTTSVEPDSPSETSLIAPAGGGGPPSQSTSDLGVQTTPSSDQLPFWDDGRGSADGLIGRRASTNQIWQFLSERLRPILSPRVTTVLLSPLLVLEVVFRALLDSGGAILWPVAALGGVAGWASRRWISVGAYSPSPAAAAGFFDTSRKMP